MLQNEYTLDEIYLKREEEETLKNQSANNKEVHQIRQNEISKFIHQNIKEKFSAEINIIYILSFARGGLSIYDLTRIVHMSSKDNRIKYGKWL